VDEKKLLGFLNFMCQTALPLLFCRCVALLYVRSQKDHFGITLSGKEWKQQGPAKIPESKAMPKWGQEKTIRFAGRQYSDANLIGFITRTESNAQNRGSC
jgi:hypothetical protein